MIPAEKLRAIGEDALRALNSAIVEELRHRQVRKQREAMVNLRVGEEVRFMSSKRHTWVHIIITDFNRKTISGHEVGHPLRTWRVSPTMCEKVTK